METTSDSSPMTHGSEDRPGCAAAESNPVGSGGSPKSRRSVAIVGLKGQSASPVQGPRARRTSHAQREQGTWVSSI